VYYVKAMTRSSGGSRKGTPKRAIDYITDGHDARRDPGWSEAELQYIARIGEGWKTEQEGGRVALVFGQHWRDWPREWVERICAAAGVPKVSAHSMRGLHSTLATEAGVTGAVVAASLGHESVSTTTQSYAKPEAVATARQERALTVLAGGRSAARQWFAGRRCGCAADRRRRCCQALAKFLCGRPGIVKMQP
jgi:hypothetical protein